MVVLSDLHICYFLKRQVFSSHGSFSVVIVVHDNL